MKIMIEMIYEPDDIEKVIHHHHIMQHGEAPEGYYWRVKERFGSWVVTNVPLENKDKNAGGQSDE